MKPILPMGHYDCGIAGIRIPEPRLPEPEPRKHGDTEPLRVPLFDIGDLTTPLPKKKDKPS